jgi:hypothetical protein
LDFGQAYLEAIRDKENDTFSIANQSVQKNILGAAGAAFRTGRIDYQLGYIDTLKPELHGTTKRIRQIASRDLPALNQLLKVKGLQPIPATSPSVRAGDAKHGSGGTVGASAVLSTDFRLLC